ncbi:MAG: trypsin-like peptidase domain-containing protein [Verrucomicrobiota bacterium]|nr:trypsin-like peptidase domain-containing protein [Verrucomicrobiota bacterium]MDQ6939708.1 trypsin-like peptidase domain-containing protein [Verrucomicrobiota bacterium]
MRTLVAGSACLIFALHSQAWPWSKDFDLPKLARECRPAVLLVTISNSGGGTIATGTGFLISADGFLVTNAHVIRAGTKAVAKMEDGRVFQVQGAVDWDAKNDVAVLRVDGKELPHLNLQRRVSSEVGERIAVVGSPLGLEGSISDGIVSAFREDENGRRLIQITAPISQGSSGSPVLNASGEVIGVATLLLRDGQSLNFAVPVDAVKALSIKKSVVALSRAAASLREGNAFEDPDYKAARKAYEDQDWHTQITALLRFVSRNPTSAQGYSDLGFAYLQTDKYPEVIDATKKALELDPGEPMDWCNLGYAYKSLRQYSAAVSAYNEAVRIDPDGFVARNAWENLIDIYVALEQRENAKFAAEQWKRLTGSDLKYKGEKMVKPGF